MTARPHDGHPTQDHLHGPASSSTSCVSTASDLGQKDTFDANTMSALPPKADMCGANEHVCFGPKADIAGTANLKFCGFAASLFGTASIQAVRSSFIAGFCRALGQRAAVRFVGKLHVTR